MSVVENVSYALSILSLTFYSIVYFPEFMEIYRHGSSDGVSLVTIALWTEADVLSLISTILLCLPTSVLVIGWYHFIMGAIMTCYVLYYKTKKTMHHYLGVLAFILANTIFCMGLTFYITEPDVIAGNSLAWATMPLYLIGRLPQIWLNYRLKSTKGLSVLMYIFTILGNACYIGVITIDPEYIVRNIPLVVSGSINIILDSIVIGQIRYYGIK